VDGRRTRPVVQYARCPARGRRGLRQQPTPRRLDGPVSEVRRRWFHRREHGPSGDANCVVVYKVDRLTRSLLDFSRIMEGLDKRGATFVSVTQQFNTTSSLGRLTLNILLSFAQFER